MENYEKWRHARRSFLIKVTIFAIVFFMFLPIALGFFPSFMKQAPFGVITYAWIFAFLQIIMTWIIGMLYWFKARKLDAMMEEIRREAVE